MQLSAGTGRPLVDSSVQGRQHGQRNKAIEPRTVHKAAIRSAIKLPLVRGVSRSVLSGALQGLTLNVLA